MSFLAGLQAKLSTLNARANAVYESMLGYFEPHFPRIRQGLKRFYYLMAGLIIFMGLLFTTVRALTPWVKQYKPRVEQELSHMLGQPVHIASLQTSWYWFKPVLKFNGLIIVDKNKQELKIDKLLIGFDIWRSLWHKKPEPGLMYIDDIHLVLRQDAGNWTLDGLDPHGPTDLETLKPVLFWLLNQDKILVKNLSASLHFTKHLVLPINSFDLLAINRSGRLHLQTRALLAKDFVKEVLLLADFRLNSEHLLDSKGRIYLAVKGFKPAFWARFYPNAAIQLLDGTVDLESWVDFRQLQLQSLQCLAEVQDLKWRFSPEKKAQKLKAFSANLAWKPESNGWTLSADQIDLQLGKQQWPENAIRIAYRTKENQYQLYLQHWLLGALDPYLRDLKLPADLQQILDLGLTGQLEDTQLSLEQGKAKYFLSRFSHLSWSKNFRNIPKISQLSGTASWKPESGALALDSEDLHLQYKTLPDLILEKLNAQLHWSQSPQGWLFDLPAFKLSRSDLALNASGSVLLAALPEQSNIAMNADWLAVNPQHYLDYLPKNSLKPKLEDWLRFAVKKLDKASGSLNLKGNLADFPYDTSNGEFQVDNHFEGLDLLYHKKWPLVQAIDADLKIDKRLLTAKIAKANLQGMPVQDIHLSIPGLGQHQETLHLEAKGQLNAEKAIQYLAASPLATPVPLLHRLTATGDIDLGLDLEVPLYPGEHPVLVKGAVNLKQNHVLLSYPNLRLPLDKLEGNLQFNERGPVSGALNAIFLAAPFSLQVPVTSDPENTKIQIDGSLGVKALTSLWNSPVLSYLKGRTPVHIDMNWSKREKAPIYCELKSDLQGMLLDLPAPFGKAADDKVPFSLGLNPARPQSFDLQYNSMQVQARPAVDSWNFKVKQADIEGELEYSQSKHRLTARLSHLYFKPGLFASKDKARPKLQMKPEQLPDLDLDIKHFYFADFDLGQLNWQSKSQAGHWQLERAKLSTEAYEMQLKSDWYKQGSRDETLVEAEFYPKSLAATLERFHLSPAVDAHKGEVDLHGRFKGPFYQFSLEKFVGDLSIELKNGRITKFDKATEEKLGLVKLLSILSLQTIPRRLQLDFSDIGHGGYSFDEFKGSFQIKQAVMHTEDSYIDGPIAYASIRGRLDLLKKSFDMDLEVSPHITASLPIVVATIAGSPIAGVATWVASKLLSKGMQKISSYSYKITGPWSNPVVEQVSLRKTKEAQ